MANAVTGEIAVAIRQYAVARYHVERRDLRQLIDHGFRETVCNRPQSAAPAIVGEVRNDDRIQLRIRRVGCPVTPARDGEGDTEKHQAPADRDLDPLGAPWYGQRWRRRSISARSRARRGEAVRASSPSARRRDHAVERSRELLHRLESVRGHFLE